MISNDLQKQALNLIENAKKILIVPSAPLDGDSLGSCIAFYLVLKKLGKEVTAIAADSIPETYSFLPHTNILHYELNAVRDFIVTIDCRNAEIANVKPEVEKDKINIIITPKKGILSEELVSFGKGMPPFDLIITVDTADTIQFKLIYEQNLELFNSVPILNIDHHISNTNFGKVNLIDVMAASTSMIVTDLVEKLGQNLIDAEIATLLLTGIITDTGSFQNPNTTPDSFAAAAHLIELGARQQEIVNHIYKTKKLSTLKLWGRVLSKLKYDEIHRLTWASLSQKDFAETESAPEAAEGIIDELMTNAPNVEIAVLLKEKNDGVISGNLRTTIPSIPANELAEKFGGGGHLQAAGFKVEGKSLREVENWVINELKIYQKNRLNIKVPESVFKPVEVTAPPESKTPLLTTLMTEHPQINPVQTPDEILKNPITS